MIKRIAPALVFLAIAIPALAFAAVPDPAADPAESASLLWSLYKAGHLVPAIVIGSFFALTLAQRWVGWLKTGWRKLLVSSVIGGLAILAESAADGTTPNVMQLMGAIGVVLALYTKGEGEKVEAK